MIGPAEVILDDGRAIRPFALAPWSDDPPADWEATAPPLLKRLRGDWVCLPFGLPGKPRTNLDPEWIAELDANVESPDPAQHGTCANAPWRLERAEPHALSLSFTPDAGFPIARIERRISAQDGAPTLDFETRIVARADCELPWGVHPTFRLPEEPGAFEIGFGGDRITVLTYPGVFESGVSRIAHGQVCAGLDAVPMIDGATRSFSALPLPFDAEELLFVAGHNGVARLTNRAERYRIVMEWDPDVFPGVLLWIVEIAAAASRPGAADFSELGVEPVSSPFNLGYAHALNPRSPMRALGIPTATRFSPQRDLVTRYRFRFESL